MAKHASPQATFYRICKTCEQTKVCRGCKARKDKDNFSAAAWERTREGGRLCSDCASKACGWWRCSVCKVKQAAAAFKSWTAQHGVCNGDQVCRNCWTCAIPRKSISKAVERVAATQAKVAARAMEEKTTRVLADVWAAISERKRRREQEGMQTPAAEPEAKQPRQDDGREKTAADIQDASAEQKRTRDVDNAATQEAGPGAKQRKDGTDQAREGPTDLQAKEKQGAKPSEETMQKGKPYEHMCPHCGESVTSTVRTGQVNHRRQCGNKFYVQDGRVVAKTYVYVCPFCN